MSLSTAVRSYKARPIMAVMALTLLGAPGTASAFESDVQQKLALWSLAFVNHE